MIHIPSAITKKMPMMANAQNEQHCGRGERTLHNISHTDSSNFK